MYDISSPELLTSLALVPEQLCGYVRAVSGMRLRFCRGLAVYQYGDEAVLIGYPPAGGAALAGREPCRPAELIEPDFLDAVIKEVAGWPGLRKITVLAPFRPAAAPGRAVSGPARPDGGSEDCYYGIPLPFFRADGEAPGQKLRNMLRRAGRELQVHREEGAEAWENGCRALVEETLRSRNLPAGTRHIYGQIKTYLDKVPGAVLFTARERQADDDAVGAAGAAPGRLHGFCVGDFSALDTAFYMFAFRCARAVPGTADLLLAALVEEAGRLGHTRVNLGLCINDGIAFFKRKWGAVPFLPYVETAWELKPAGPGLLARLFGRGGR